jgi:putative transposase
LKIKRQGGEKVKLKRNKPGFKQRVIQFELNPNKKQNIILSGLTYASSKLWNVANYEIKNWSKDNGQKYPNWYDQKTRLKNHFWYKRLPSQSSQEILKQLHEAWQSFYKLKQTGAIEDPKPPGYKHTNFNVRWLNKGFIINNGIIRLSIPKQQKKYLKEKHDIEVNYLYVAIPDEYKNIGGNPKVIEIIPVPKAKRYKVNIIIELPPVEYKEDNGIYMGIDLGINNLMTCYITTGKTFIISGRQLLSINRYYDKTIGHYQSIAYAQQTAGGNKYPKDTKRIQQLYAKRRKQINHLLHAATKKVIEVAEKEGVTKIIIGDITYIRENKDLGHKNNQKFHKWPFKKIEKLIKYKAEDRGIRIEKQEESYTSQCSPYEEEISEKTAEKTNRKHRGLYIVNDKLLNADCVGAYNIMKKYLPRVGKPATAVVGLDTPAAYRWSFQYGFIGSTKLANSLAM